MGDVKKAEHHRALARRFRKEQRDLEGVLQVDRTDMDRSEMFWFGGKCPLKPEEIRWLAAKINEGIHNAAEARALGMEKQAGMYIEGVVAMHSTYKNGVNHNRE